MVLRNRWNITMKERLAAEKVGVSYDLIKHRLKTGWDRERAVNSPVNSRRVEREYTDEDIKIAESNGINERNLRQRVQEYGWDVQKAITEPIAKRGRYKRSSSYGQWKDICEKNGISYDTFNTRVVRYGWSESQAANTPVVPPRLRGRYKALKR